VEFSEESRFLPSFEEAEEVIGSNGNSRTATPEPPRCSSGSCPEPPSRTVQAGGRCPAGLCFPGSSEESGASPPRVSLTA
jgi:hypothetical protein